MRVAGPSELEFPNYDGNGMFRSLGNVRVNAKVGLLFLDFEQPRRLRINGTAELDTEQMMVRVRAERIFPNCPRYIHRMKLVELSVYAPAPGHTPPVPAWKRFPQFNEVLPPGDPARET